MIEIEFPDLAETLLDFTPDGVVRGPDGDVRGADPNIPSFLMGRVRVGGPQCVPITANYVHDDADLRAFVEQEVGRFAYHLIHLSITFAAEPEKPRLERATVELTLRSDGLGAPSVWSMRPEFIADPTTVKTTMSLGPELKLSVGGADVEAKIGSISREKERPTGDRYLQAELAGPTWRFRATEAMPLRGSQQLDLVVRAPWQAETTLQGRVTASTLHHKFLRWEHAPLPWPLKFHAEF